MTANEVAIVVGAGPGLGAALCRRFVKAGMLVAAATRDKERVTAVAKEAGARGYGCDAGDEKSVLELFAAVKRDFGEPSVVVYNAGAYLPKAVIDTSAEEFERCWRIGCFGGFLVGREAARAMLTAGELMQAALERGLAPLYAELRRIEDADPECLSHPRLKARDDATALLVRVTRA